MLRARADHYAGMPAVERVVYRVLPGGARPRRCAAGRRDRRGLPALASRGRARLRPRGGRALPVAQQLAALAPDGRARRPLRRRPRQAGARCGGPLPRDRGRGVERVRAPLARRRAGDEPRLPGAVVGRTGSRAGTRGDRSVGARRGARHALPRRRRPGARGRGAARGARRQGRRHRSRGPSGGRERAQRPPEGVPHAARDRRRRPPLQRDGLRRSTRLRRPLLRHHELDRLPEPGRERAHPGDPADARPRSAPRAHPRDAADRRRGSAVGFHSPSPISSSPTAPGSRDSRGAPARATGSPTTTSVGERRRSRRGR